MPIEITGLPNSQLSGAHEGATPRTNHSDTSATQSEPKTPSLVDTLSLTKTATQLQTMERDIANIPVVDMERVKTMQLLLDSGNYEINTSQLADKLLRFEAQL